MVEEADRRGIGTGTRDHALPALSLDRPPSCPSGCGMTRAQIEEVAERWAARAADRDGPAWIRRFVEACGGEIRPDPSARLLLVAERDDRFVVSADGPWPLAEALGHVALHLPHVEEGQAATGIAVPARVAASGEFARARAEAAWFAAAFLMPEQRVRAAWERHGGALRKVAAELRVPMASAAARALRLGLR